MGSRSDQTHEHGAADGPCVARMTSVNGSGGVTELDRRDGPLAQRHDSRNGSISKIPDQGVDLRRVWSIATRDHLIVRAAISAILPPLDELERALAKDDCGTGPGDKDR
jgi:hypothetical protein